MISSKLAGGLGNYLFQIGAGYTLAKNNNSDFSVDFSSAIRIHKDINTYKDNILRKIKNKVVECQYRYTEPNFTYSKIPHKSSLLLSGYFQSEKYLNRDLILDLYSIDSKSYDHIKSKYLDIDTSISLHVRRGDYLDKLDRHPPTELSYCQDAVDYFGSNYNFYVMSDDIKWCKENLKGDNFFFIDGEPDHIDLWLMSLCEHNIITNSTFSWWGSWLNKNKDKKVIAPKQWFGISKHLNSKDLYCDNWTIL
mgnify:CR=1 FL=1